MLRHFIFDLDGTLIDSKEDIKASLDIAFASIGRRKREIDVTCIGLPLREIAEFLDSSITDEEFAIFQRAFRQDYDNKQYEATSLMEGVLNALRALAVKGIDAYVATTKPSLARQRVMDALGISSFFKLTRSVDSLDQHQRTKVNLLERIIFEEAISPAEAAYVGDQASDVYAALACRISAIAFLGGYGNQAELLAAHPDFLISSISEIPMLAAMSSKGL